MPMRERQVSGHQATSAGDAECRVLQFLSKLGFWPLAGGGFFCTSGLYWRVARLDFLELEPYQCGLVCR